MEVRQRRGDPDADPQGCRYRQRAADTKSVAQRAVVPRHHEEGVAGVGHAVSVQGHKQRVPREPTGDGELALEPSPHVRIRGRHADDLDRHGHGPAPGRAVPRLIPPAATSSILVNWENPVDAEGVVARRLRPSMCTACRSRRFGRSIFVRRCMTPWFDARGKQQRGRRFPQRGVVLRHGRRPVTIAVRCP